MLQTGCALSTFRFVFGNPAARLFSLQRPEGLLGSGQLQGGHQENRNPEGCCFRYPRPWGWLAAERPGSLCLGAVHSATGVGIPRRPCLFATASSCRPPSNPRGPPPRREGPPVSG